MPLLARCALSRSDSSVPLVETLAETTVTKSACELSDGATSTLQFHLSRYRITYHGEAIHEGRAMAMSLAAPYPFHEEV